MPRQPGVFASLLAELRADLEASEVAARDGAPSGSAERGTAREDRLPHPRSLVDREPRLKSRKRSERIQSLRGRRQRVRRPPSARSGADLVGLDELDVCEDSLETRCVRPSLRFQQHVDIVVTRSLAPERSGAIEVHDVEPGEGVPPRGCERVPHAVEVERVRVLKPAAASAHLAALDRAFIHYD